MNQSIYQKNRNALREVIPAIADSIEEQSERLEQESANALLECMENGSSVAAIIKEGYVWYLNSRYDSSKSARVWAMQYTNVHANAIFWICGFGNGMAIRLLLSQLAWSNRVCIYEPCPGLFWKVMHELDISDILADRRVFVVLADMHEGYLQEYLNLFVEYSNIRLMEYGIQPNYDCLYDREWKLVIQRIQSRMDHIMITKNTLLTYIGDVMPGILSNGRDMVGQGVVNQLVHAMQTIDTSNVPAIIVAAGPSLDKNIHELKNAEGKAFLIVVDTALKAVLNADITPDMLVTVDPHKEMHLFEHEKFAHIPLAIDSSANPNVISRHQGKRFYISDTCQMICNYYRQFQNEEMIFLETGGSVANDAFSLAVELGFQNIILVGQDLAYTDGRGHTKAAYNDEEKNRADAKTAEEIEVEDIYGNMIRTSTSMQVYLRWFEMQMERFPDLNVIDATEGGAKIRGTRIMPLKEVIETYCRQEVDFGKLIDAIPPAFTEEEQEQIRTEWSQIGERLDELERRIKEGIRNYERLEELHRKGKNHTKEYQTIVVKLRDVNDIENEPLAAFLCRYMQKEIYEVKDEIFKKYASEREEVRAITDNGIKMLKSYQEAIWEFRKDLAK